jgi:hypothetical protein
MDIHYDELMMNWQLASSGETTKPIEPLKLGLMGEEIISKPHKPYVTDVKPLDDWKLQLSFENGEERIFDMKPYRFGVFARLEEVDYFERVRVVDGSISWPHGQDLAYDMLYVESKALSTAQ